MLITLVVAWDTGSIEDFYKTSATIENRQIQISCIEKLHLIING